MFATFKKKSELTKDDLQIFNMTLKNQISENLVL